MAAKISRKTLLCSEMVLEYRDKFRSDEFPAGTEKRIGLWQRAAALS